MTVCVAAIAAKSRSIVMVADKALTYRAARNLPALQFDTGVRKIVPIGQSGWYALAAGDPTFATDVIEEAKVMLERRPQLGDSAPTMRAAMKVAYKKCRERAVRDNVLSPNLLDKTLLVARPSNLLALPNDHYNDVVEQVARYQCGSTLLVCGFDNNPSRPEPHIFSVVDPGVYRDHDMTGFHAIGVGEQTAIARLLQMETDRKDDLPKALYGAFDAKVSAEVIQSVGYGWDAEILVAGRTKSKRVPKNIVNLIDNVFNNFPRSPFDTDIRRSPKNWHLKLGRFARTLIPDSPDPVIVAYRGKRIVRER